MANKRLSLDAAGSALADRLRRACSILAQAAIKESWQNCACFRAAGPATASSGGSGISAASGRSQSSAASGGSGSRASVNQASIGI